MTEMAESATVGPLLVTCLLIAASYALGGVSLSYRVVRRRLGADVRELGSGNPGATNVLGLLGALPAVAVLGVDVGKGALAVLGARAVGLAPQLLGAVAAAVVVGHIAPATHQFRGGKGVATTFGAFGVLSPLATSLALIVFLAVVLTTRYVAIGSCAAALTLPAALAWASSLGRGPMPSTWIVLSAAATAVLIVVRHRDNARRIAAGTERYLGNRRGASNDGDGEGEQA